jgi:hypothetical protein
VDFTVNVTTPFVELGPEAALMEGDPGPEVFASVTVLPETGMLFALFRVTVIVEVVEPSAVTDPGDAVTVDCAAETALTVKVTVAVWVSCRLESVVSVAVKPSAPVVVDFTVNVTTPFVELGPEAALMVGDPGPELFASVTVLPETGLLFASFRVTVIVEVVEPSAVTDPGDAVTVDCAAETAPAVKVTVAVCVTVTESVVSVAVKISTPAVVDFTVNVTTPLNELDPEAGLMVGDPGPELFASVTVLPETGLLFASFRVTVIVEVVEPSAVTDPGNAVTVDCAAETAPAVKVTVAVWLIYKLKSVTSSALKPSAPAVVDVTVNVTTPFVELGPEAALMVGDPGPEFFASVTVLPETGLLFASFRVTVIVEVVEPSAVTDPGDAVTVDCDDETAPTVKVTVAVCVTVTESVVSVAVKTSAPAFVDFTVNVTTPSDELGPEAALMVGDPGPELFASVTVLPETGLLFASFRVTVIVEVVEPSAGTDPDDAVTVDCAAVTAPGLTVNEPLVPVLPLPPESVAVIVWVPDFVTVTL